MNTLPDTISFQEACASKAAELRALEARLAEIERRLTQLRLEYATCDHADAAELREEFRRLKEDKEELLALMQGVPFFWNHCRTTGRLLDNSCLGYSPGQNCRKTLLTFISYWQHHIATNPMLLGYARVSKSDDTQDPAAQIKTLKEAGCTRTFTDKASGGRWDRPELHRALDNLRPGDTLVVVKLDRLSRSLKDLLHLLDEIRSKEADFKSLTESFDTSTPSGRMTLQLLGVFSEFERAMIRERTRAGLRYARERGKVPGRRPKLTPEQETELVRMVISGEKSSTEAARLFNIHRSGACRLVAQARLNGRA